MSINQWHKHDKTNQMNYLSGDRWRTMDLVW